MSRDLRPYAQWPKPKSQVAAPAMTLGYLVEIAPDEYEPTADASEATHIHVLDSGTGDIVVAPIGTDAGGVRTRRIGEDTYLVYGA